MSGRSIHNNQINKHHRSAFLTEQVTLSDDNWTKKKSSKLTNRGEATLLEIERDETPLLDFTYQNEPPSPEQTKSVRIVDNKRQSHNTRSFSPDDLDMNTKTLPTIPESNKKQLPSRTKTNIISSPIQTSTLPRNVETRKPISKIPVRSKVSSHSTNNRQIQSSTTNKGAFHIFSTDKHSKKDTHKRLTSTDDDDDDELETNNLKKDDLKKKLKEEKRHGKKTGELLNKLHESYEELLEKYAHAENTIDQLRFQPKLFEDNTPRSTTNEGEIHFIQQPKMSTTNLRSSGIYHSINETPLSSMRLMSSTTTTTPVKKSISPDNSGTNESIYSDEVVPQKVIVQEITSPETLKLDLVIQIKTLCDKMKAFATLMDNNQLSCTEQKQIYENIKQDYEKLLQVSDQTQRSNELNDTDLDADINKELETMKRLLKDIVKCITQNLLGKSNNNSEIDRHSRSKLNDSQSSQSSVRSSLCNHNDLVDQYQKLLTAVNTRNNDRQEHMKPVVNGSETGSRQLKKATSRHALHSDLSDHPPPTKHSQKPYVYVSGDSDDEQLDSGDITPLLYTKGIESTSFELDHLPPTSGKHLQINEAQIRRHDFYPNGINKKKTSDKQETQELDHPKSKRKIRIEQKKITNKQPINGSRYSRTRVNDYDSGIGTNNTTKQSRDSKLYDETYFQSYADERKSSSSRSSVSGSTSPGSPNSKYSKRLVSLHNNYYRRKPSGHSDSDIKTHIIGSLDMLPQPSSYKKRTHRSCKPQINISHHSRSRPSYRSTSIENSNMKSYHRQIPPTQKMYRSSLYINQGPRITQPTIVNQSNNLYLDQQTGIIYGYESYANRTPIRIYPKENLSRELYQCDECGSITTYQHRHHINSPQRCVINDFDDLGYESGNKKRYQRRRRYIDYLSSSDSDSDLSSDYLEMIALNEAYARAERVQHNTESLSRYINRQVKLVLATV